MRTRGKVLVIEDNRYWQTDLREYLEAANYYVEVADNLDKALEKVKKELFHFITIDMQLKESTVDAETFEGWEILQIVIKLRVQRTIPVMVITGFEMEYQELRHEKECEALFFMSKGNFDGKKFIDIVERETHMTGLTFFNDHRSD
jgi:CheY-like chemotaxis protein